MGVVGVSAYLSLIGRRRGGHLFKAGRLLTFSAFRMDAYSRWALIRGWALIRINTVYAVCRHRHSVTGCSYTPCVVTGVNCYEVIFCNL